MKSRDREIDRKDKEKGKETDRKKSRERRKEKGRETGRRGRDREGGKTGRKKDYLPKAKLLTFLSAINHSRKSMTKTLKKMIKQVSI